MNLIRLAWRSISGNSFRSWVVGLCSMLVASLALATTLVVRGAQNSLNLASIVFFASSFRKIEPAA